MAVHDTVHRKLTYEDYLRFPEDGKRHEILDGEHYVSPAPQVWHQIVSSRIHVALGSFVDERRLGVVLSAPVDVLLSEHDIVQPDLVFVSRERLGILDESSLRGAPDLVVEILSPRTRRVDEGIKRERYELLGVREYWIADASLGTVRVYRRAGDRFLPPETFSAAEEDLVETSLLPGFTLSLLKVFEQL